MRSLSAEDVLHHMEVPQEHGLFVLGCFERRVTLRSQQVRALNLVYALCETGRLREGSRVAVVGGGAAGMTVAAAAAQRGCSVTLLEKTDGLLPLFRGNHTRWLHPHIYDWPREEAQEDEAGLPLLSWRAATADQVARQLEAAWNGLPERSRIQVICGVGSVDPGVQQQGCRRVSWNAPGLQVEKFDAVVLAVGFGLERQVQGIEWCSYWDDDRLHQTHRDGGKKHRHLISGCGDGGLVDLLRVRLHDFRHERLVEELLSGPGLEDMKRELLAIEEEAHLLQRQGREPAAELLYERYSKLQIPAGVDEAIVSRLRSDTEAVLNGLDASPLTLDACILNRFLVSRLLLRCGVGYRAGAFTSTKQGERYRVQFRTGVPEEFDHITCRHGPKPGALESGFPDLWPKCEPLRSRNELDQTRWPLWPEKFFAPVPLAREVTPGKGTPPGKTEPLTGAFIGVPRDSLREGFKGRAESLERLHEALLGSAGVALTGAQQGPVFAHGSGGIGKSRLAIEYAWRHRRDYPGGVFFVVAEERPPEALWAQLARAFLPETQELEDEEAALSFVRWLGEPGPGRRLVILDDIQASLPEELAERFDRSVKQEQFFWPPPPGHVSLLVTTRMREFPGARGLEVRQLDDKAALELLVEKAGHPPLPLEMDAAVEIAARILGGHPLAISLAGAYVRRLRLSFEDYKAAVRQKGLTDRLEAAARAVGYTVRDHERSIAATYELSRRKLDLGTAADELAWRLLKMAAFLAPNVPMDRKLLRRLLARERPGTEVNVEDMGLALARLVNDLSLLDPVRDEQGDRQEVVIHPLVADYTRWSMEDREREQVQLALIEELTQLFPQHPGERWKVLRSDANPKWERLSAERVAHAEELWKKTVEVKTYGRYKLGLGLGDMHFIRGSLRNAGHFYQAAKEAAVALRDKAPENASFQREVSVSLNRLGDVLTLQGASEDARKVYDEGLSIAEELVRKEPGNLGWRRDVWVSLSKQGGRLIKQERLDEAREVYERNLVNAKEFVRQDPGILSRQRDLSVSLESLGDVWKIQGQLGEARKAYAESMAIMEALIKQEPGNAEWLRDLSVGLEKLGLVSKEQGHLGEARNAFEKSLAISEGEARREPEDFMWRYDISVGLANLAGVLKAQGALAEAREGFARSLALAEELTEKDPENLDWQEALVNSRTEFAELLLGGTPEELSRAEELLKSSKVLLTQLAEASRLSHELQNQLLPRVERLLRQLNPPSPPVSE